jgi:quinol monooxygenase YgiN
MRAAPLLLPVLALLTGFTASALGGAHQAKRPQPPLYVIAHFDVLPMSAAGVDFLQTGYGVLFKYRDQSKADTGLESFRILDLMAPMSNHSQIVQVWSDDQTYREHLAQAHTSSFRFEVQNNPRLGGICCVGSPIDDRQYTLARAFGTPWPSPRIPATVGASGALFVINYIEFLPQVGPAQQLAQLVQYGDVTSSSNGRNNLSYSVLRELYRPNRFAVLEIWANRGSYDSWQSADVSRKFVSGIKALLGSPIDHRLTSLCGNTFVDGTGCTSP